MGEIAALAKKTPIEEHASIRSNGLIAIDLDEQGSLIGVHHTSGDEDGRCQAPSGNSVN